MKNAKWLTILLIALTITFSTLIISCCNGNGDGDPTPTATNPPVTDPPPTTPPPTDPPVTTDLPPDPGDAGKVTLQGIDSDSDGIRDDVQISIVERYPNDEEKQAALNQEAKALQEAVVAGNSADTNTIIQAAKSVINSVDCMHVIMEDPWSEISFLEDIVINTSERSEAYIMFNEALSGQFFGEGDTESPCQ